MFSINDCLTEEIAISDAIDLQHINSLDELLCDCLSGIEKQFSLTIRSTDKEDYIKTLLHCDSIKYLTERNILSYNKFIQKLKLELNSYFEKFFGINFSSKVDDLLLTNSDFFFANIYYRAYRDIILTQSFLVFILHKIFSNIPSKLIQDIESTLNIKITKFNNKNLSKKFKIKSTNYILDMSNIIKNVDDLSKLILNTTLFSKHLYKSLYGTVDIVVMRNYLYEIFFSNASLYEVDSLFRTILKLDNSVGILLNMVEVYALEKEFSQIETEG